MFLEESELNSVMYAYQLGQITQNDSTITQMGIAAAIEEVRSYLTPNLQHQWTDGRPLYDTNAIFSAEGSDRNPLILELTKTVAVWRIIQLCNADMIYEHVKERYDRAVDYLKMLAQGKVSLATLPVLNPETDSPANKEPWRFGSRTKFNHE